METRLGEGEIICAHEKWEEWLESFKSFTRGFIMLVWDLHHILIEHLLWGQTGQKYPSSRGDRKQTCTQITKTISGAERCYKEL